VTGGRAGHQPASRGRRRVQQGHRV
jgi:hypothetical protein